MRCSCGQRMRTPSTPRLWTNLAASLKALGRRAEEMDAIEKALQLEPRHLSALLQKVPASRSRAMCATQCATYQNALACIPPGAEPAPAVREGAEPRQEAVEADWAVLTTELEGPLAAIRERTRRATPARVDLCLEALMGKRSCFIHSRTWMYFPELPAIEFFDREDFRGFDAVEAAGDEIRAELLRCWPPTARA